MSGALERCFTRVGSNLIKNHWTRLERNAREKHSSLLRALVNYGHEKFYNIGLKRKVQSVGVKVVIAM
jgi:hypothetical protein